MNNTNFASKILKGRDVSAAPLMDNYNKSVNIKEEQNGRSMIEMLGVLAIIGVLSVGGIAGYSKAMMKYRINKTIEQITLIAGNIRTFFGPQKNYAGVSNTTILRKAKLVPDEMWNGNNLVNAFGGNVQIFDNYIGFRLTWNVPKEACIELLSQDWSNANVSFMGYPPMKLLISPASIDDAITVCDSIYDGGTGYVEVSFWFDADYTLDSDLSIINK